jgi:hypothetical protein
VLAFRQAKKAVEAERDSVGLLAFAEFEIALESRIKQLRSAMTRDRWFDRLDIGRLVTVPKAIQPLVAADDVVRVGLGGPKEVGMRLRMQLDPTPEFATAEVLYLWEFGGALESLLLDSCLGYRLKRVSTDGTMDRFSRDVYEYWRVAFERYRNEPIAVATDYLSRGHRVAVISTDVSSFFDSVDPAFLLTSQFVERVESASARSGRPFDAERYLQATRSLLACYGAFRQQRLALYSSADEVGVPIGSLISRVIAVTVHAPIFVA